MDHLVDYTQEDFPKNGQIYDLIFDVVGKSPYSSSLKSLKENGVYLIANPQLSKIVRGKWTSAFSSKKVVLETTIQKTEDLIFLRELIEAGKIKTVIDRRYTFEQTAQAHRYVETGQKKGNLIITLDHT